MSITQSYSLIDTELSPEDATEILSELIRSKINFHNNKNFSSIIRFDKPHIGSKEKIYELFETKEKIKEFIQFAKSENKRVKVYSDIIISIES